MDNWELKPCNDLNRMLKIRTDLDLIKKEDYPNLIILRHRYATSDDIIFPEPATLGFFATLEKKLIHNLENAIYVAQDIHTGLLDIHIYSHNYQKTILQTVEYLKLKPEFHIEFIVTSDVKWDTITNLGE